MNLDYIKVFLVVLIAGLTTSCQKKPPSFGELEGLYKYTFPNKLEDGTEYTSENRLMLYQASPHAIYFEAHLDWANRQSCDFSGIVDLDLESRRTLSYSVPSSNGETCTFTFLLETDKLVFGDSNGACKSLSCNRGMLDGVEFQYNTREGISPEDVKKSASFQRASQEYYEAGR